MAVVQDRASSPRENAAGPQNGLGLADPSASPSISGNVLPTWPLLPQGASIKGDCPSILSGPALLE